MNKLIENQKKYGSWACFALILVAIVSTLLFIVFSVLNYQTKGAIHVDCTEYTESFVKGFEGFFYSGGAITFGVIALVGEILCLVGCLTGIELFLTIGISSVPCSFYLFFFRNVVYCVGGSIVPGLYCGGEWASFIFLIAGVWCLIAYLAKSHFVETLKKPVIVFAIGFGIVAFFYQIGIGGIKEFPMLIMANEMLVVAAAAYTVFSLLLIKAVEKLVG